MSWVVQSEITDQTKADDYVNALHQVADPAIEQRFTQLSSDIVTKIAEYLEAAREYLLSAANLKDLEYKFKGIRKIGKMLNIKSRELVDAIDLANSDRYDILTSELRELPKLPEETREKL